MQALSIKELKFVRSLKLKKYRHKNRSFVAEGTKVITELLKESQPITAIYASESWMAKNPEIPFLPDIRVIPDQQSKEISQLSTNPGISAIVQIPEINLKTTNLNQNYTLLLDKINDPGNLGTLIRLADWYGMPQIICSKDSVDCFNQKTIQATMGSIARVKVFYEDLQQLIRQHSALPVYAAVLECQSLYQYSFPQSGFLLLGSESHGISDDLLKEKVKKLSIPKLGKAESLNVAMAAGIIVAEVFRQKML